MKKPPKAAISEAEFRPRLKKIAAWRKKRPAELRADNWCSTLDIAEIDLGISTDKIVQFVCKRCERG